MRLFKTTIVIWSREDHPHREIGDWAAEATEGDSYCSRSETVSVADPESDPDWDGTEFFIDEDGPEEA